MIRDMKGVAHRLLDKLKSKGVQPQSVVFVSFDEAGSSSPSVLNLLRDACLLQNLGCHFVDAKDVRRMHELTNKLGSGALVYVDDFIGSGTQFCKARQFAAEFIVGNFSETLLVHTICEEGIVELSRKNGVEHLSVRVHTRNERPLHELSSSLPEREKERLRSLALSIHTTSGLGFNGLATMVVYYRNAPNTVSLIYRGSRSQRRFAGIIPRTTDLSTKAA